MTRGERSVRSCCSTSTRTVMAPRGRRGPRDARTGRPRSALRRRRLRRAWPWELPRCGLVTRRGRRVGTCDDSSIRVGWCFDRCERPRALTGPALQALTPKHEQPLPRPRGGAEVVARQGRRRHRRSDPSESTAQEPEMPPRPPSPIAPPKRPLATRSPSPIDSGGIASPRWDTRCAGSSCSGSRPRPRTRHEARRGHL